MQKKHVAMTKMMLVLLLAVVVSAWQAEPLHAQDFVYTNNDISVTNTVSAFSVALNGVLTQIAGSPFVTGGSGTGGGLFASNRITVCVIGNFLFISNDGSSNVSAFSINATTGNLTPVPGSPFATGGFGDISLAAPPNGQFLMAGNSGGITVFSIAGNGALTPISGSPFPAGGTPDGMKASPDGQFLSVALPFTLGGSVGMFSIAPNGSLTPVPGSPFPDGSPLGVATGTDINCASNLLFASHATSGTIVDVYNIAGNGALAPIAGSPFVFPGVGSNSNVPLLSPNDQLLFVSNQTSNTVTVFNVAPNGSLTVVPGSPFPVGGGAFFTSGLATNKAGTLLYTANFPNLVGVFSIALNGALTPAPGSPFSTGQGSGLLSLAAFPPKACVIEVSLDIKPQSCPNPLNVKSNGVLPVAILGTANFDVNDIDVSTIELSGVSPIRSDIEDVSTPVVNPQDECECTTDGDDGVDDLTLKFDRQEIVAALGAVNDGDEVVLTLTGELSDGTRIEGKDCIVILKKGKKAAPAAPIPTDFALGQSHPNPFNPETWIPYRVAKDVDVAIRIYNASALLVRTLNLGHQAAGIYSSRARAAYWDGRNDSGEPVSSGIYFYTIHAGEFTATRKMLLLK
ncbi:hypothetical protein IH992_20340 [Candidatus Poribacteria bacterium]|nr:hypothetical protein [Candidatus Poribacteria bacterium]